MAKSKQTFQKSDREKKKQLKLKEKSERREIRKQNSLKGKGMESMMAYVDHNGQLSSTPPDPKLRVEIKAEDILLGPQSFVRESVTALKTGRVAIYITEKRYGFIKDGLSQEKIFFHESDTNSPVKEGSVVSFETRSSPKGIAAVNISVIG
jgi:cold shock CspA family protein